MMISNLCVLLQSYVSQMDMSVCLYVCMDVQMYVQVRMYVWIYVRMYETSVDLTRLRIWD